MCRNIRILSNFEPPATEAEIRAAALQFVRKICGSSKPSKTNQAAFDLAVDAVANASQVLLSSLVTQAAPKNRDVEAEKARRRNEKRFSASPH